MRRLPRVTAAQVEEVLHEKGYSYSHSRGSHRSYVKGKRRVILPHHGKRIIPPGTLKSILRQAGISEEQFRQLLK